MDRVGVLLGVRVELRVRVGVRELDLVGFTGAASSTPSVWRESSHASHAVAVVSPSDMQHMALGSRSRYTLPHTLVGEWRSTSSRPVPSVMRDPASL
jgi:hypothetical protein